MSAAYDISASRAESIAQAANLTTPTIFNFGGGDVDGGWFGQSASQAPTATAARNATGDMSGKATAADFLAQPNNQIMLIAGITIAGLLLTYLIVKRTK